MLVPSRPAQEHLKTNSKTIFVLCVLVFSIDRHRSTSTQHKSTGSGSSVYCLTREIIGALRRWTDDVINCLVQLFELALNPSLCASTAAPHRFVTSHHETNNQSIDSSDGLIAEGVCKCQDDMTRTTGGLIDTPQALQALRTKSTNPVSQISSRQFTPIEIVLHAIEGCPHYRQLLSPHHQNPQNPYQITIQQIQQRSQKTNNTDANPAIY